VAAELTLQTLGRLGTARGVTAPEGHGDVEEGHLDPRLLPGHDLEGPAVDVVSARGQQQADGQTDPPGELPLDQGLEIGLLLGVDDRAVGQQRQVAVLGPVGAGHELDRGVLRAELSLEAAALLGGRPLVEHGEGPAEVAIVLVELGEDQDELLVIAPAELQGALEGLQRQGPLAHAQVVDPLVAQIDVGAFAGPGDGLGQGRPAAPPEEESNNQGPDHGTKAPGNALAFGPKVHELRLLQQAASAMVMA